MATMSTWFVTGGSGFVGRNLIRDRLARSGKVRALARSDAAIACVEALGAEAVRGSLDNVDTMTQAMKGCDVVVHAAAKVDEWGAPETFHRVNVEGTEHVLRAAAQAGVRRLIHIGTEAPYATGKPIVQIDETRPFPSPMLPRYPASKGEAELRVRAANSDDLETIVLRPRMIWGNDDSSLLPQIVAAVHQGRFMWIGDGMQFTSTCHVDNLCAAIDLAATSGTPGAAYFITDGPPTPLKPFLTDMLASRNVEIPDRQLPFAIAWNLARTCDAIWTGLRLNRPPPVSRVAVALIGTEVTVRDDRARQELGYQPVLSRDEGLARLAPAATPSSA